MITIDTTIPKILSPGELDVFCLYGKGMTTREIAAHVGRSPRTIDTQRSSICRKLDLAGVNELIAKAAVWIYRNTAE